MIYKGNTAIDSICFSNYNSIYDKDFTESIWEVNTTNGWEVEFTKTQAIIKKFKIDTWGIRRNIKSPTNVYSIYNQWVLDVQGLAYVNENVVTFGKSYYPLGGWKGYDDATSFAPGKYPNDTYPISSCQYVSGLIIQFGGQYNTSDTIKYPSEQMLMHPWDVGNRVRISDGRQTGTWADSSYSTILIGLYGGSQDSTSDDWYKVYDISDHPIILTLVPNLIDPQSRECWKLYYNNIAWEKEKTLENNWVKYKYVIPKFEGRQYSLTNSSYIDTFKDPPEISYPFEGECYADPTTKSVTTIKPWVSWNYQAQNDSFWDYVKQYYAEHDIVNPLSSFNADSNDTPGLFANSNIAGELTLNINNEQYQTATDIIRNTGITKITFNFKTGEVISALNVFRGASKLTEIVTNKPFWAKELSGTFEFCESLTTIPADLIRYNYRNMYNQSNLVYTFEGCKNLVTVPMSSYAESVYSDKNTIRTDSIVQAFNNCPKLQTFYPILDLEGCLPNTSNTTLAFAGCTALTHILIKNLNKGDWRFDGTTDLGTLSNLDTESVKYLLNNVKDIANSATDTETQNNSFSKNWTEQNDFSYTYREIYPDSLDILCTLPVDTQIFVYKSEVNNFDKFYFLPAEKVGASDMDNYKISWDNSTNYNVASINSSGNSNYGFYIDSSEFVGSKIIINLLHPWDRCSSTVTSAKIYIPEVWKTDGRFTQSEIDVCNSRGWHIYIGSTELTTLTS